MVKRDNLITVSAILVVGILLVVIFSLPQQGLAQFNYIAPQSTVDPIDPYQNSTITITATVIDESGSGIESVTLMYFFYYNDINKTYENTYYGKEYKVDREAPWEWEFSFPQGKGRYEFYSEAIDNDGNVEYPATAGPPMIDTYCNFDGNTFNYNYLIFIILIITAIVVIFTFLRLRKHRNDENTNEEEKR